MKKRLLVITVLMTVAAITLGACSTSASPSTTFHATATAVQVYGPGSLGVAFQVQNVGTGTGAPSCTVTAAATASEGGVNIVNLQSIGPGHWDYESTSSDLVSISGNAASQVDINNGGVTITCT